MITTRYIKLVNVSIIFLHHRTNMLGFRQGHFSRNIWIDMPHLSIGFVHH